MEINGPAVVEYDVLLTQLKTLSDVIDRDADGRGAGRSRALFAVDMRIKLPAHELVCHCEHTV